MVRAAYLAMELTAWFVIVPLSLASPLTGLVQSLGTTWGLFRHYWVLTKFLITIPASIILLMHMRPIGHLARVVADATLSSGDLGGLRIQLVANAGAALLVLLVATTLSIYKPRGMTRYGRRKQREQHAVTRLADMPLYPDPNGDTGDDTGVRSGRGLTTRTPRWVYVFGIIVLVLVLLFVIQHLTGGGLGGHTP